MNERIRELVEQVGAVRNVMAMGRHDGVLFTEFELEKFAELVVRECMEQLNISNVPAPISAGLNLGRVAIKEHFGVKE